MKISNPSPLKSALGSWLYVKCKLRTSTTKQYVNKQICVKLGHFQKNRFDPLFVFVQCSIEIGLIFMGSWGIWSICLWLPSMNVKRWQPKMGLSLQIGLINAQNPFWHLQILERTWSIQKDVGLLHFYHSRYFVNLTHILFSGGIIIG